jgi:hypothetical protein
MGRRYEVATVGIDEALQGFSSDPFGSSLPGSIGLRVPTFVNTSTTRYLFLLATRTLGNGQAVRVRGWRQYVTIGLSAPLSATVGSRPVEFEVVTPGFRFADGNVSWHLVREPPQLVGQRRPTTDLPNFMYQDADQPALLYQSYTQSVATGFYMLDLTAYVPPTGRLGTWEPIAGLGNVHDLRAGWRSTEAWDDSLDELVAGPGRVSLYASVLQTNPGTRPKANNPTTPSVGDPPEETFIFKWNAQGPGGAEAVGVQYWRIAGSLILEDC